MNLGCYGSVILALAATGDYASCQVPLDQSGLLGKIEVLATDCFGTELPGAKVTVQYLSQGQSPTVNVQGHLIGPLEYGRYRVTVADRNFEPASKDVVLGDSRITVLIGLVPNAMESTNLVTVTGSFIEPVTTDCRFMRLIPLFTTVPPLDAVVHDKKFAVADVKPGKYTTVLLGTKGICRTSEITVWLGRAIQVITVQ